ncbi:MAG: hypothetical protein FGM32_06600 [Candidatus Kapabacteria bacterium]|nr:hypothetical protein [Candidatus Kapabacteria bacterium]
MRCVIIMAIVAMLADVVPSFSQIPAHIPQNGLVAWWPFNGDASDESMNGNDGTVNGALLTTDRFGTPASAYAFDGVNDNITLPNVIDFGANSFTVSLYCRVDEYGDQANFGYGDAYLFGAPSLDDGCCQYRGFYLAHSMVNGRHLRAYLDDGQGNQYNLGHNVESDEDKRYPRWAYLTMVYSREDQEFRLYVNGELSAMTPVDPNFGNTQWPAAPTIGSEGRLGRAPAYFHDGKIDDIAVWNRALTPEEILNSYNACDHSFAEVGLFVSDCSRYATLSVDTPFESNVNIDYSWQIKAGNQFYEIDYAYYHDLLPQGTTLLTYQNYHGAYLSIYDINAASGVYRCQGTINGCVFYSDEFELTRTTCDITITSQPTGVTVNTGAQTTISVAATSNSTVSYKWQIKSGNAFVDLADGNDYGGVTSNTLTIKSARAAASGPFRCVMQAAAAPSKWNVGGCCATSNEATITVTDPNNCNIAITSQPQGSSVKDGQTASMTVGVSSSPNATYQWQRYSGSAWINIANDPRFLDSTSSKLTIESATNSTKGPFRCVVTSGSCSVTSNEASLTVSCNCGTN